MFVKDKVQSSKDFYINPEDRFYVNSGFKIPLIYKFVLTFITSVSCVGILYIFFSWSDSNNNTSPQVLVLSKKKEDLNPSELYALGNRYEINGDYQKAS